jgi:hypothetical protein
MKYIFRQFQIKQHKMKVNTILSLLIIFHFLSCKGDSQDKLKNKTDLEKENLKGKIILVIFDDYQMDFFNKSGNLIKEITYFPQISSNRFLVNEYENNKLKFSKSRDAIEADEAEKIISYSYDSKGNLISENNSSEFAHYSYNQDNQIELIQFEDKDDQSKKRFEHFYYTNGAIDSTIRELSIDGTISELTKSIFNSKSQLISQESFVIKVGLREKTDIYTQKYNANGDNIEFIHFDQINDKINFHFTSSYLYDDFGNWIKYISYNFGKDKREYNRKIFYEGDDIREFESKFNEGVRLINEYKKPSNQRGKQSESDVESEGGSGSSINDSYESNSSSSQSSQTEKRKCSTCGGNGQCSKCSKPQRVRYKQGESPNDHNEIRTGMIVCTQCGGNLMNFGTDRNKSCYLCKATGWLYCSACNVYGNGRNIGKCQRCNGTGFDK